jgi:hypothetical protein
VGEFKVTGLNAGLLDAKLRGAGNIQVAGQVTEQWVTASGPGEYHAPHLESRKVTVRIKGMGNATVWAVEELDVTVRGMGRVAYYGHPRIVQKGDPMMAVTSLGDPIRPQEGMDI